ncbi:hypothetical protein MTR67_039825, partial [Solanum verrucosum]
MDFIMGLPRIRRQFELIWIIMHRMMKLPYVLHVKTIISVKKYAKLYIWEMVRLNRVPFSIITDCGTQFKSPLYRSFHKGFGTQGNWDDRFPLIELAYSNSYHSNIGMSSFVVVNGAGVSDILSTSPYRSLCGGPRTVKVPVVLTLANVWSV